MSLNEYTQKVELLLRSYDGLIANGLVPYSKVSTQVIDENKENLKKEKFLVSFTGQIKSGKSTLINAIVFGKEILPMDDLPHTAKITIMQYGDQPSFTAKFYDSYQWDKLKNLTIESENYFDEYMKSDVEQRIRHHGIFIDEVIRESAIIKSENDLALLNEYVAADGKYTPFVDQVTINYPSEILRKVDFVDTPGINDPNVLRSEVTKNWISRATANIYVTYAGRAMDESDISFIDDYLLHVHGSKRMIAVNKIDTVNSENDLKVWIEELRKNPELMNRGIMNDKTVIHFVCSLGFLLNQMIKNGIPLNEDHEFYKNKLDKLAYVNGTKNGVETLITAIEKKLLKNKGAAILESHKQKIENIFNDHIKKINLALAKNKDQQKTTCMTQEELNEKKENFEVANQTIQKDFQNLKSDIIAKQKDLVASEIKNQHKTIKKTIQKNCEKQFKRISMVKHFQHEVLWIIKNEIEDCENSLFEELGRTIQKVKEIIESEMNSFKNKYKSVFDNTVLTLIISIPLNDVLTNLKYEADAIFNQQKVSEKVSESTWFWQRWLNTNAGKSNVVSRITADLNEFLEKIYDQNSIIQLKDRFTVKLDEFVAEIEGSVRKRQEEIGKEIESAIKDLENQKETLRMLDKEKLEYQQKLETIEKEKYKFSRLIEEV